MSNPAFELAKARYEAMGIDVEAAMETLKKVPVCLRSSMPSPPATTPTALPRRTSKPSPVS